MFATLIALVQDGAQGGGGGARMSVILIQLALFVAIFYFILIRPSRQSQKRHQVMQTELRRGDEVVTDGGIVAKIVHVADDRLTIKTADDTRLIVVRSKVARRLTPTGEAES
ncbi:MAG: preprotein translocase subunit YajC [Gemmatimonadota bacterium]